MGAATRPRSTDDPPAGPAGAAGAGSPARARRHGEAAQGSGATPEGGGPAILRRFRGQAARRRCAGRRGGRTRWNGQAMASNPIFTNCRPRRRGLANSFERRAGSAFVVCPKSPSFLRPRDPNRDGRRAQRPDDRRASSAYRDGTVPSPEARLPMTARPVPFSPYRRPVPLRPADSGLLCPQNGLPPSRPRPCQPLRAT